MPDNVVAITIYNMRIQQRTFTFYEQVLLKRLHRDCNNQCNTLISITHFIYSSAAHYEQPVFSTLSLCHHITIIFQGVHDIMIIIY